jgi:hypothetical protein
MAEMNNVEAAIGKYNGLSIRPPCVSLLDSLLAS